MGKSCLKSFKDKPLEVVADKGYINHDDMSKCLEEGRNKRDGAHIVRPYERCK